MGGGCAVMGMPQGTGPEQLDLAVQADERTLQGGGTLEQNGRGQGTVTWNVLPTELCLLMCPSPPCGQLPAWAQFWVDIVMPLTLHLARHTLIRVLGPGGPSHTGTCVFLCFM